MNADNYWTFFSKAIWPGVVVVILLVFRAQIRQFFETLKDWAEISGPGVAMKRKVEASETAPPEPSGKQKVEGITELTMEARKVISTLWKHQREYYPDNTRKGRWSFKVSLGSTSFADYLMGVGETIKKGLVTIDPKNGYCLLTDAGIYYCETNESNLLTDWDYERWKV